MWENSYYIVLITFISRWPPSTSKDERKTRNSNETQIYVTKLTLHFRWILKCKIFPTWKLRRKWKKLSFKSLEFTHFFTPTLDNDKLGLINLLFFLERASCIGNCVCVCVCVREREMRQRNRVCVYVCAIMCACVWWEREYEREKKRERESLCVYVWGIERGRENEKDEKSVSVCD